MSELTFRYPPGMEPNDRYPGRVASVAQRFMMGLFDPPALRDVTSPDFVDRDRNGNVVREGLPALVEHRTALSATLLHAEIIPIPRSETPAVPGTRDSFGFSAFADFAFTLPKGPRFPARVRVWESLDVRSTDVLPGGLWVAGRMVEVLGATSLLEPGKDQHAFVAEQVAYFENHGQPMPMNSLEKVYTTLFPEVSFRPPGSPPSA